MPRHMKTADQFSPGDETPGTGYGDSSGIGTDAEREDAVAGSEPGGTTSSAGMPPQDESAFDEATPTDAVEAPYNSADEDDAG